MTDLQVNEETRLQEPGDHDRYAHIIPKKHWHEAYILGNPVEALCGKRWVPTRSPEAFPLCSGCKEIYDSISGGSSADDLT